MAQITEVLPKAGLVFSERGSLSEALCKPKLMPIKSATLEKLEQMEKSGGPNAAAKTGGATARVGTVSASGGAGAGGGKR